MQTEIFPDSLSEAWVKQLLKKIALDLIDKNYHPISNLQFSGKNHQKGSHWPADWAHIIKLPDRTNAVCLSYGS